MPHSHAPKKVAIIGAGPSGLVTAKTLLHNAPGGFFLPTIFEKTTRIGGLWACPATDGADTALHQAQTQTQTQTQTRRKTRGFVNPAMRTNLSRYTVAFSDLGWESVLGEGDEVPMFPEARQVRRYLDTYAERFLLREGAGVVRLGCEVVRVERGDFGVGWVVEWVQGGDDTGTRTERFDYLVVASGYFARPVGLDIPISGFEGEMVHSSAVQEMEDVQGLLDRVRVGGSGDADADVDAGGKLVVVGGSMSGVEAASAVALHLSSSSSSSSTPGHAPLEVHHICSRPFWMVPTYLPHTSPDQEAPGTAVNFLPLDLVFYDRARRPPGQIEYAVGPLAPDQISRSNAWFRQLLGSEYARIGSFGVCPEDSELQPSWVAIGNDYAEYVRAGAVKVTIGRVAHLSSSNDRARARVGISLPTGESSILDNVAAIILATGFTPRDSLAFLPPSILSTLEYAPDDAFIPLILDNKGTSHSEIPDLGFVGFYRGPYWGVMEMQARSLAARWSRSPAEQSRQDRSPTLAKETGPETDREKLRRLRHQTKHRSQFPMGDYVGLMESFARELGIPRLPIPDPTPNPNPDSDSDSASDQQRPLLDPVIPARYPYLSASASSAGPDNPTKTLSSLATTLSPTPSTVSTGEAPTATAIFRALHGAWHFSRTTTTTTTRPHKNEPSASLSEPEPLDTKTESPTTGSALFKPRYTTLPGYEREYLYTEIETETETNPKPQGQPPSPPHQPETTGPSRSSDSNTTLEDGVKRSVYRLLGDGGGGSAFRDGNCDRGGGIHVWDWECDAGTDAGTGSGEGVEGDGGSGCQEGRVRAPPAERFSHGIQVSRASLGGGAFDGGDEHEPKDAGGSGSGRRWYGICGIGKNTDGWGGATWEYIFHLEGVSIIRWECVSAIELESGRKLARTLYLR
ncbi:uncharacterized protein BO72DRAFT_489379 [Aspergillus fijiensis CBS 313.89]|uniref:FAD/NAD(P)-binding domain-containing protein n=1 Tax=Aspergillus fijiensis CBS 313.89 TaxID=1448319 RepID=A0A8G1VU25_9EURO|nr:uncharacterized protein BO72DRAFT_489379 [Aspergillus fijiensis CBS 313.89]RAK72975.1 hypothetical protein BO72DRAFT_489379 [Aspergillus fijiensis CBS 313.89]